MKVWDLGIFFLLNISVGNNQYEKKNMLVLPVLGGKNKHNNAAITTVLVLPVEVRRNWGWQRDTFRVNVVR